MDDIVMQKSIYFALMSRMDYLEVRGSEAGVSRGDS